MKISPLYMRAIDGWIYFVILVIIAVRDSGIIAVNEERGMQILR